MCFLVVQVTSKYESEMYYYATVHPGCLIILQGDTKNILFYKCVVDNLNI